MTHAQHHKKCLDKQGALQIGDRIKEWRRALGLTQEQFAKRCGLPQRTLVGYENHEREPGGAALAAIARTGVNTNWLLTGEGEMHASPSSRESACRTAGPPIATGLAESVAAEEQRKWPLGRDQARWEALVQLVDGIDDAHARRVLLDELFACAQSAAEVDALRRAVQHLHMRGGRKA